MDFTRQSTFADRFYESSSLSRAAVLFLLTAVVVQVYRLLPRTDEKRSSKNLPYGLEYFQYLPRWISGFVYSRNALTIINAAHAAHPNTPYKLARLDTDMVVLPESVVDELAGLPNAIASNILALQYDLVARWTGLSMLQDVNLHLRVVQRRLTPNMGRLTLDLEEEVTGAVYDLFPQLPGQWVERDLYHVMMQIAARVFSRMVVGPQFCRDQRWLDFAINFTQDVFNSIVFIRFFPSFLHPIFRYVLPSVTNAIKRISQVEDLLVPVFSELLRQDDEIRGQNRDVDNEHGAAQHGPLDWFTDIAHGDERDPVKLVHAQILLALGAIHTSLFAEMNILYDLMSNPSYIQQIRDETTAVSTNGWDTGSYAKLHKLDSILRESQRMSPPFLTGLRRVMKQDYVFSNGIRVSKGEYVCVPTFSIQNNNLDLADAGNFDGLRSYNLKAKENSWKTASHQFATTESSALAFGHGRTACPGRFLASLTLKIIFTKLMNEYDFELADGFKGRPSNQYVHEIIFPTSQVKVRVRRRENVSAPF